MEDREIAALEKEGFDAAWGAEGVTAFRSPHEGEGTILVTEADGEPGLVIGVYDAEGHQLATFFFETVEALLESLATP